MLFRVQNEELENRECRICSTSCDFLPKPVAQMCLLRFLISLGYLKRRVEGKIFQTIFGQGSKCDTTSL